MVSKGAAVKEKRTEALGWKRGARSKQRVITRYRTLSGGQRERQVQAVLELEGCNCHELAVKVENWLSLGASEPTCISPCFPKVHNQQDAQLLQQC